MAKGREAVDIQRPLNPAHLRPKSKGRHSPKCLHGKTFYHGDGLSKEVWVGHEWKLKLWSRGGQFLFIK